MNISGELPSDVLALYNKIAKIYPNVLIAGSAIISLAMGRELKGQPLYDFFICSNDSNEIAKEKLVSLVDDNLPINRDLLFGTSHIRSELYPKVTCRGGDTQHGNDGMFANYLGISWDLFIVPPSALTPWDEKEFCNWFFTHNPIALRNIYWKDGSFGLYKEAADDIQNKTLSIGRWSSKECDDQALLSHAKVLANNLGLKHSNIQMI